MKVVRKLFSSRSGFALVELVIGLIIVGLLVGAILGGAQMIKNSKIKRQVSDLRGLYGAVYTYFDQFLKLPGDKDADGYFDADSAVWMDVESEELVFEYNRSPYGTKYFFGSDTTSTRALRRNGNYIRVSLPADVARNIDQQLDDGVDTTGWITSNSSYEGTGKVDLYYFID